MKGGSELARVHHARPPSPTTTHYAFGLAIDSDHPIAAGPPPAGGDGLPHLSLRIGSGEELEKGWTPRGAERLLERRYPSGKLVLSIDHHPELGYRLSAPGYGRYLISEAGDRVLAALPHGMSWRWQRLLFAQVLPLAATLRGLVAFHASSVQVGERAITLVAASGTGKTSTAAHLVAQGAGFMTDDVTALETRSGQVIAHPGADMMALDLRERRSMSATGRDRLGTRLGRAGKTYFACSSVTAPVPLGALFYLERGVSITEFSISEAEADAQLLLSSAFIWYLNAPEHLRNLLEISNRIAEAVPLFRVSIPYHFGAPQVADRIAAHAASL